MMRVQKRTGEYEEVSFDKVIRRIKAKCLEEPICKKVDYISIAQKVCTRIYDGVKTSELDELAANTCISLSTDEPEYGEVASRIIISNNHKNTPDNFREAMAILDSNNDINGNPAPIISDTIRRVVEAHFVEIESVIDYKRDYMFSYFGFKVLEGSYLKRVNNKVIERPQHMWMRVSLGIHMDNNPINDVENLERAFTTYNAMSSGKFTHATPTLFNSGTCNQSMLSCFLLGMEDSIPGIFKCISDCAQISKGAGGIGFNISNIRSKGAYIRGSAGHSSGIIPMLRVFNNTALYVNQSGKRNGSFAVYIEPWHADIFDFLDLKKNHGDEAARCRDLFLALWVSDLFMERVRDGGDWCLMDPDECPGLTKVYGDDFKNLYEKYESEGRFRTKILARNLWNKILESQIETGVPYICYKDAVNIKSNQKNLGTITNSNLCSEIVEYSDSEEYACCTLASIGLPAFVIDGKFNYTALSDTVKIAVYNLNKIIDTNLYPVPETKRSNQRHRPIGLGVQGLADVYMRLRLPFDSPEASTVNKEIFATIYYSALEASLALAIKKTNEFSPSSNSELWQTNKWDAEAFQRRFDGGNPYIGAYSSFEGSPISQGQFQFDMWGVKPIDCAGDLVFDWDSLRNKIMESGIRNSLLVAPMPTASTSQILGYNECFEPITSNIYVRRVLAGEFIVVNKYLVTDLQSLGIWNKTLKDKIILHNGSIQDILEIPKDIRDLYKTSWDLSMKTLIDQSADRGVYICQTQSLNLFVAKPDFKTITSMHFYAWKKGLKTGIYYLRTQGASKAQQFTIDPTLLKKKEEVDQVKACRRDDPGCLMCSS